MKKVVLGEVCDFFNGGAWSDKEYVNEGIPVLKVTNCKSTGFQLDNLNYLSEKSREKYKKNNLIIGDIIVATVGSHPNLKESAAGRSCIVNSQVEGFYLNQNAVCIRTKDKRILSQKYLGYLCKCADFQHYIQSRGRGAANQMRIAISSIKEYSFTLPDFENQQYIADVLSAYDDLIENNQKQIKLLEEAAQRLYKEWFVDLRFPGHENTEIVDGVPEGWHRGTVGQIAEFKRGQTITKAQVKGGNVPVVAGGLEPAYYHNVANTKAPVITISASGANAGFVRLYGVDVFASDCSFVDGLGTESLFFVYEFLKESKVSIDQLQKGSAQPHVYAKDINAMKITIPEKEYLERFDRYAKVYFNKIKTLQGQNERLKIARDLLLPKLMNGKVEV